MQITPAKIAKIIKAVLKSMVPSVNVESLKLPKRSAALYMHSQELPTVNDIHKATVLSDASQKHPNTDGTTLNQQKLNSIAVNDLCLSVGEVPDGTADSVVEHIDRKLNRLRELAHNLKLNGANNINWNCITSSSSDGASTQKRLNKLLNIECKTERDLALRRKPYNSPCAEFLWHAPGGESAQGSECRSQAVLQGSYRRHGKQLPRLQARRSLCS